MIVVDKLAAALPGSRLKALLLSPAEASRLLAQHHHLNAEHNADKPDQECEWCRSGKFGVQY